jgi:hypothetical protein
VYNLNFPCRQSPFSMQLVMQLMIDEPDMV